MFANTKGAKRGVSGGLPGSLAELYNRRWLIAYFSQRQLTRSYRGSFLGFVWVFLSPLLMIFLYTLVFSEIIGLRFREVEGDSSLNFGLYLYCGLLPFLAYSEALNQCVNSIRGSSGLVQKVVFPLEVLPMSTVLSSFADKFFGLGALVVVVALVAGRLEWTLLLLPVLMVPQLLFNLGLGYLFAVVGTYLPDVRETLRAIVRASFFITPIIWPVDRIDEDSALRLVVDLNPLAFLVTSYRDLVLEGQVPDLTALMWFSLFAGALCVAGFWLFTRLKKNFADLV